MAFTILSQQKLTQPATAVTQYVNVPSSADYIRVINITQRNLSTSTAGNQFEFYPGIDPQNSSFERFRNNSTTSLEKYNTTGGFVYNEKYPDPEAAVTGTTITQANGAVASATNTYSNGDRVIIYNAVGMEQISGMVFTISSVSGSQFTLTGLDSSGFAFPATSFFVRRIAPANRVEPRFFYVTKVSQATQAVVTLSEAHDYVVGMKVEFTVPGSFGMIQLNNFYQVQNLPATIVAVGTYTITVNIDTTAYTTFAFPASSGSPTTQLFATVAPAGAATQVTGTFPNQVVTGYNFQYQPFRSGLFTPYVVLPVGADSPGGQANDVLLVQMWKAETGTIQ
ncbi:MAG TPA: hypothetical protein VFP87_01715 [Chitinophagaceae bacterium]|nr:hypothetical protein [Chitinophagaceae bacterium]